MISRSCFIAAILITCALSRAAVIGDPVASFVTKHCLECHDRDLSGDVETRPLTGGEFFSNWDGSPVLTLFDRTGQPTGVLKNALRQPQPPQYAPDRWSASRPGH